MIDGSAIVALAAETHLRRALLRAGQVQALPQDKIDCAELALAGGARNMAAILYGLVALEIGFPPASLALLREVDARENLWRGLPEPGSPPRSRFSIDLALDELRRLMRFRPKLQPLPASLDSFLPADVPMTTQLRRELDPSLLALARRVGEALRDVPRTARNGGLAPLLAPFADQVLALSPIHTDHHADADLDTLAHLLALEGTRRFLLASADLLTARPAELFDEVAALDPGALGPFFSNVKMLLRGAGDLFALIDAAAGGRADAGTLGCWAVLLSAHLPGDRLVGLAAEMGDRGMATGLRRMLVKVARAGGDRRPFDLLQGIRDASLDIDAFAVAADAQQLIALWRGADGDQWRRLGEIRGYDGDLPAAKAALERALQMDPADAKARDLLALVEAGQGIEFEEIHVGRRNLRRARLAAFQAES